MPVADVDPAAAASTVAPARPPSARTALTNAAFAPRRPPTGDHRALGAVDARRAKLGTVLDRWVAGRPGAGAVAVAVAVDGHIWTGAAHTGAGPRLDPSEEFGALSMTKTLTTALALQQVDAGRLALDTPVPRLDGLRPDGDAAAITVRHLLEHSSGLIDYPGARGYDGSRPLDAREAVRLVLAAGLQSPPGAEVHYANTNFLYLGLVLEHVTGRPYADLVSDLAAVRRLPRTRLGPGAPGWPGYASGGVVSTLADLGRWGDALFTPGRILPEAQVRQLVTLDERNMALSMWPLCPCGISPDGDKQYTAIGQSVGYGGLFHFPSGLTLVVRFDPVPAPLDDAIVSLGQALEEALRSPVRPGRA
jgi:CubicO group peptidase (beta-lactamase class C family)